MNKDYILQKLSQEKEYIQSKYEVDKIGLFGSYAKGTQTENSDIDIFVKMKPSLFDMVAIKEQIENDLNRKVDIIREHKNIKPIFLKMIQKDLIYA